MNFMLLDPDLKPDEFAEQVNWRALQRLVTPNGLRAPMGTRDVPAYGFANDSVSGAGIYAGYDDDTLEAEVGFSADKATFRPTRETRGMVLEIGPSGVPDVDVEASRLSLHGTDPADGQETLSRWDLVNDGVDLKQVTYSRFDGGLKDFTWGTDDGTEVELMRLTTAGRLGVGTASPAEALDVVGDIQASGDLIFKSGTGFTASFEHALGSNQVYTLTTGGTVWTSGNDGTGSGLDADLLDGLDSSAFAPAAHALLSATHNDTAASAVSRGSLIYGNATPAWAELVLGAANTFVKSDGTDLAWASGAALSRVDDTNVTLTLGGSATTALVNAASLTLGWTGTLAAARLNSNVVQGVTNDTNVTGSIAAQNLTLGWTGTLAAARLNANVVQSVVNDTNVTGSIATQALTIGWSGQLSIARGGTGQATATAAFDALAPTTTRGDLIYHNGTDNIRLAIGTTGKFLRTDGTDPSWQAIAGTDVTGAALTKADDTNVTLTLGGDHATALLRAASLTLGWTGQLGLARGGTNADLSATGGASQVLRQSSAGAAVTVSQLAASDLSNGTTGSNAVVLGTAPTIAGGSITALTTFSIFETSGTHSLAFAVLAASIAADRTLTIDVNNADRTLDFGGNIVVGGTLTTAAAFTTSGANALTLTTTGSTNVTLPTTGTLATLAGAETFTSKILTAPDINGGTADSLTSLSVRSTGAAFDLLIASAEVLTANRTLTIDLNNAARTLEVAGNAVISGTNTGDQTITLTGDVTGSGTGSFAATIANDAVTFAKMADAAAWTIVMRNAATTGDLSAAALADVTAETTPASGDFFLLWLATGEIRKVDVDDMPGGGGSHDLLSATHGDTTASAVSRGSIITGQGASPTWTELVVGGANTLLKSDGTDVSWGAVDISTAQVTGTLPIANGGTGQTTATAAFDALAPSASAGGLIVYDGSDYVTKAIGTDGFILTADSAETGEMKWARNQGPVVYVPTSGDFDVSETSDVTIVTRDVTGVAAGDQIWFEGSFTISNNSGSTRVYVITMDFDGLFDVEFTTAAVGVSATAECPYFFRAHLDVRTTVLCYGMFNIESIPGGSQASGTDITMAATTHQSYSWGTSASDVTGTCTVTLKVRSASTTDTQTLRLHGCKIEKVTPT